jgi:hypothetical protein
MAGMGRLVRCLIGATIALAPAPVFAQVTETAVKAAFLPRFARYVTWPPAAAPKGAAPFAVCVIGSDPFGGMLDDAVRSQSIDGRRMVVKRLDTASGADGCQIAFVEGTRSLPTGQLLAGLGGKPILTVTDAASGGQRGMIHFAVVGGRVRFFIDESVAAQRGLSISSRLLALAIGVKQR